MLTLRYDTLDVWRLDDHTIRYRVSYKGWFSARLREALDVGFMHFVVALVVAVPILVAVLLPDFASAMLAGAFGAGGEADEPGPLLRPLEKRMKAIATTMATP